MGRTGIGKMGIECIYAIILDMFSGSVTGDVQVTGVIAPEKVRGTAKRGSLDSYGQLGGSRENYALLPCLFGIIVYTTQIRCVEIILLFQHAPCNCVVLHYAERRKMEEKQKELLHPKMTTVLQQRRLASATKEKRTIEMLTKPKAITGLIYSLILNMMLVFALSVTMPSQTSTFLRIIHGSVCLSALIISRVCSSVWFSDIANASLKYTGVQTPSMSLSFEYLWMSLGIGLRARINLIERNWPYFLGYGTVLTLLTSLTDNIMVNALLFGAVFPFCIVSSFLVEAGNYKQRTHPYVHIFGPSIATTNYMTSSLSDLLKSIGSKNAGQASAVSRGNVSLRDHHSYSPMRRTDPKAGRTRIGSSFQ
uniref:Uncharacterized protein n=1 Tax=Setaria digitata TaxID=48799 RepID=A0A915Q0T4_9BILA